MCEDGHSLVTLVLTALYLRGAPHGDSVPRKNWPRIRSCITSFHGQVSELSAFLRDSGFIGEAQTLGTVGLLDWAKDRLDRKEVLSAEDQKYFARWIPTLGTGAPPALWKSGEMPVGPFVAVAGSRALNASSRRFAYAIGSAAAKLGFTVVSGGATGADAWAARGALEADGAVVEMLPAGLNYRGPRIGACGLTPSEPWAEFTSGRAMERNALIYASAPHAIVIQPRFLHGGTWHGSTDALKRGLSRVWVHGEPGDQAVVKLCEMGAKPIHTAEDLAEILALPDEVRQPLLFDES